MRKLKKLRRHTLRGQEFPATKRLQQAQPRHHDCNPHVQHQNLAQVILIPDKRIACKHERNVIKIRFYSQKAIENTWRIRIEYLYDSHPEENGQPEHEWRLEDQKLVLAPGQQHGSICNSKNEIFREKNE